ncbi:MAG: ABC transporter ATP-binding protein [Opitutae bacterium]|nr:ABC transporter ATP-binding protein [Opitutae bacterium]
MNLTSPPALRAESLVKEFSTDWRGHRWRAVDGVSFAVPRGAVCGIVGPNGSGKSTTLKLLAGVTRPTAGSCHVAGRIGYLPESPGFPDYLTGRGLLAQLAALAGLDAARSARAVAGVLESTGLTDAADRPIREYSKGMRQRIGLAQALLDEPEILLLDEPASGLDPRALEQFGALIRRLRATGCTIVLSAHFLPKVEELCDQVILLEQGRMIYAGNSAAVQSAGGLHRLYLERIGA